MAGKKAKRNQKQWMYNPKTPPKPKVPDNIKQIVQQQCDALIETTFKPSYCTPPPEPQQFNYIVDLYNLWYRNFFYFCAKYRCPGENCISEFFEVRYTRLEYTAPDSFNLAYMRHTGQWWVVYQNMSLSECLSTIKHEVIFQP